MEAKAWYVCGTEITARFRASQTVLIGKRVYVVLVAWIMSDIVFGTPTILGYRLFDASEVARIRDEHYHQPIDYLVIEPEDTAARTVNLRQANVAGFKLDRINHPGIEYFKAEILSMEYRGRTISDWTSTLRGLTSEVPAVQERALGIIRGLYP